MNLQRHLVATAQNGRTESLNQLNQFLCQMIHWFEALVTPAAQIKPDVHKTPFTNQLQMFIERIIY